ncbi:MAG: class II glutamine amidotransferase [Lachnospiraceae bacterium]|nr:class II glutamine amidotransferase [Lachnospiraceae bacterium]
MCELFGSCSENQLVLNEYLKKFYSHSTCHPNGWGLALLDGNEAFIEKEPLRADKSHYLQERLSVPVQGRIVLAHIRYATIGNVEYRNCHPFTGKDCSGRRWTLIHNGTIFEYEPLNRMVARQSGDTDSERILLYLLEQMDREICSRGVPGAARRFRLLDEIVCQMASGNKLNLIFSDGEYAYVHTNYANSLYQLPGEGQAIFSTQPLGPGGWELVPMTTLLAYKDGRLVFTGTNHGEAYLDNEENMKYIYQIFAEL